MNQIHKAFLLLSEFGPAQLADNVFYRMQLRNGYFVKNARSQISISSPDLIDFEKHSLFSTHWIKSSSQIEQIVTEAEGIVSGNYHTFGEAINNLDLSMPQPLEHWTKYGDTFDGKDIKLVWEPARFTWAIPLTFAYFATKNEIFAEKFWQLFENFVANNPVNLGPNWSSGQEVALRLIPWCLAGQLLANSPSSTKQRDQVLSDTIWQHVRRIPPTLHYARSQNNNHLLSESIGLMIGGWLFENFPEGKQWFALGKKEFQKGILAQIAPDGTYSQHSTNYHRMLMQLALIYRSLVKLSGLEIPHLLNNRLIMASRWLSGQMDSITGNLPNLGHNDGTDLFPIGEKEYRDYRPIIQAASRAFLGGSILPPGDWDELSEFLQLTSFAGMMKNPLEQNSNAIHRSGIGNTWASLRSVQFHSRPAHADQLHVDLWWDGINIATDPGTYTYNLPPPWDNSLAGTSVHNTVMVNNQDQMFRAGKFLWLQRSRAKMIDSSSTQQTAILFCDTPIAYTQIRKLKFISENQVEVCDSIEIAGKNKTEIPLTIQWLLPDWDWQFTGDQLNLRRSNRAIDLIISASIPDDKSIFGDFSLVRAGEGLLGNDHNPIRGWYSNSYNEKTPALSLAVTFKTIRDIQIKSLWLLKKR